MNRKKGIYISILIILLVFISTIAATYSVIINVVSNNGVSEIVNVIKIRDLMTNDNGSFNNTYYNVKNELVISDQEAEILMESNELNAALQVVLKRMVSYKIDSNQASRMSDQELYDLIMEAVNKDNDISQELKNKIDIKSKIYIRDVFDFIDQIDISVLGNK